MKFLTKYFVEPPYTEDLFLDIFTHSQLDFGQNFDFTFQAYKYIFK